MSNKIFACVLFCGVACGGSTSPGGASGGTGGASGQGAASGHGASAGVGQSGAGGLGGGSAGGSGGSGGAASGAGGVGGATAGTGGASCGPNCGFKCCGPECVNPDNDINNCGACGTVCPGPNPYCDNGKCGTPPCLGSTTCGAGTMCCEAQCCTAGQLCCEVSLGTVGITCMAPTDKGTCPTGCAQCVCTAPNTPIATPSGERAISELKVGDLVYSVQHGQLEAVPIILINRVKVTGAHHMVEVRLSTGTVLSISPSHPTADGRTFADLAAGDSLDGVALDSVRRVPYHEAYTYDILPDSDSGSYFAGGVLIGTTLAPPPTLNHSANPVRAWASH